ncbi:MAG: IS66-like element accessory protein TnpA [Pseudomonadota bacterium]
MPKQDTQASPKRRRHAEAFRRELVERSLRPGASVSGIALENGVNTNMLFRWRREHLRAATGRDHGAAQAVLLPVKVAPVAVAADRASANVSAPAGVIEIDIGGVRVRLRGAVDEANLRCVLQTLRAAA